MLWCCWLGSRKGIRPVKNWVVGCWHGNLSWARCRLAMHMAQLMPLLLTVFCFSEIQVDFIFLVPGSLGQRAVKRMCMCVRVKFQFCWNKTVLTVTLNCRWCWRNYSKVSYLTIVLFANMQLFWRKRRCRGKYSIVCTYRSEMLLVWCNYYCISSLHSSVCDIVFLVHLTASVIYLFIKKFNDFCQTSYLKIYRTNLRQIFRVGRTSA